MCNIWQPQNMMCCLLQRSTKLCWDETLLNWSIEKISNNFFKPQWKKPTSFEADVLFLFFIWSVVNAICTQWSKIENVIWNSRVNKDQFCILMLFSSHFGNLVFGCFCQWSYQNITYFIVFLLFYSARQDRQNGNLK